MTDVINEKKLRKELRKAEHILEQSPDSSIWLESVARCLYWLGDPKAREYLCRVACEAESGPYYSPKRAGNYYRLAGELEKTKQHFKAAYDALAASLDQPSSMNVSAMMEVGFHLGRDKDVESLAELLKDLEGSHQKEGFIVAQLAKARLTGDAGEASKATQELRTIIVKDWTITPSATNGFDYLSWYEIALRLESELAGQGPGPENPLELLRERRDRQAEPPPRRRLTEEEISELMEGQQDQLDLYRTDLSGMNLSTVDLSGVSMVEADLSGADLSKTELIDTNLRGAILKGAKLTGTEFQDTDMTDADLESVDLSGLNLEGTQFLRANLRDVNLSGADLSNSDLTQANLTGADLRGADLDGADLEGATMDDVLR